MSSSARRRNIGRPALPRVADEPADRQALLPLRLDLHRHLVVGPADAPGAHFDGRLDVFDRAGEDLERVDVLHLFLDLVHGPVEDARGGRLLAVPHQAVDELADEFGVEPDVRLQVRVAGGKVL